MKSSLCELIGKEPVMTTCKKRDDKISKHTIDYIFYDSTVLSPVRYLEIPDDLGCLPSWKYPSDHIMLCVGFKNL